MQLLISYSCLAPTLSSFFPLVTVGAFSDHYLKCHVLHIRTLFNMPPGFNVLYIPTAFSIYLIFWGGDKNCLLIPGMSLGGLPRWLSGKESACQCRRCKKHGFNPWVGKVPWKRAWQPTLIFLPGESCGQRSLVGYGPRRCQESDTTGATERTQLIDYVVTVSRVQQSDLVIHFPI